MTQRISIPLARNGTAVVYPGTAQQWSATMIDGDSLVGDYHGDLYLADGTTKAFDWQPWTPPQPSLGTRITALAFISRWTPAEEIAIRTAAKQDVQVETMIAHVQLAKFIDLVDPRTRASVQALEAAGLLAAGRATQILDAAVTETELP